MLTVRNQQTREIIRELEKELKIKTSTGVIDFIATNFLPTKKRLERAEQRIRDLEKKLSRIEQTLDRYNRAQEAFKKMCDDFQDF